VRLQSANINTSKIEDSRLAKSLQYSSNSTEYIVNYIYDNRYTRVNTIIQMLKSKGHHDINESDIDSIMLWIRQIFNKTNRKLV